MLTIFGPLPSALAPSLQPSPFKARHSPSKDNMSSATPRPCPHSVTRASSFESVSVSLIDSEQLPPAPPTIAPLSTTFRRLRHRRCFSAIPHPHRIRRRRHPDGNVTLWHLRKKEKRRRNSDGSSCLCGTWNESSTFHKFERALLLYIAFAFAALLFSGVAAGKPE